MRFSLFVFLALLCASVARAEPAPQGAGHEMAGMTMPEKAMGQSTKAQIMQPQRMESMSMEQQMAVCSRIETLKKQGKALNALMQQQKAACDTMAGGMSAPAQTAPDATLER
ncbi:hypothetical protein OQ252_11740 [Acetobacter farinalis]|uniref:Uncharacterized protein n=1 Tax=Acetobacter farinalis TaxID=1260984 RepID=A0ABT3Q9U5_9PROT|nr:hypothetical protein [Acetobacter farinalis]MCX2562061.1 hypothetical protein [Acetobacter farinalis]NHO30665.1 hypothetical protein [Acetobacter farinalis]